MFKKLSITMLLFIGFAFMQPCAWGFMLPDNASGNEEEKSVTAFSTPSRARGSRGSMVLQPTPSRVSVALDNPCKKILKALKDGDTNLVKETLVLYIRSIPYTAMMGVGPTEQRAFNSLVDSYPISDKKSMKDGAWKQKMKNAFQCQSIDPSDVSFLCKETFFRSQFLFLCKELATCVGRATAFDILAGSMPIVFFTSQNCNYVLQFYVIPGPDTKCFDETNTFAIKNVREKLVYRFKDSDKKTIVIDVCLPVAKPYEVNVKFYEYDAQVALDCGNLEIENAPAPEYVQGKNIIKSLFAPTLNETDESIQMRVKHFFESWFKAIPQAWIVEAEAKENFYKNLFFCLAKFGMSNACSKTEVAEHSGRIDVFLEYEKEIQFVEFKFNGSVDAAIKQIKDNGYAEAYRNSGKSLTLIGVNVNGNKTVDVKIERNYILPPIKPIEEIKINFPVTASNSSSSSSSAAAPTKPDSVTSTPNQRKRKITTGAMSLMDMPASSAKKRYIGSKKEKQAPYPGMDQDNSSNGNDNGDDDI